MPKSKRSRVVHMTNVTKKNREHKERLFESVRDSLGAYQHCFVFAVDSMRNTHLKEVRQDLSDSRFVPSSPPPPPPFFFPLLSSGKRTGFKGGRNKNNNRLTNTPILAGGKKKTGSSSAKQN